jgi:ribonucleoside-diphosphate reductase beta chain
VWNQLISNFWVPERVPVANDIPAWRRMSAAEKETTKQVFVGLTMLDTIQATVGAVSLIPDANTDHEQAVLTSIAFQESIHAKSYSTIFSTLCSSEEIDQLFDWAMDNEHLKKKAEIIMKYYDGDDPLKRKIASTLLESFLFFSGFYWPFYLSSRAKLTNSADIVRLIVADESVHGYYIGQKFQQGYSKETPERQTELRNFGIELLLELYEAEIHYTEFLYDDVGVTEDVKKFLKYNANKAFQNLGWDGIFEKDETEVSPEVMAALSLGGENHDFFSGAGSSYKTLKTEEITEEDWDF